MPEEMNAYEAERAARIDANKERMRALGLAKGGALRVGGLGESEADYLDAPGAGPALGARPKPRKGGKTSAASKRAREPAAPARASRRLRGIDVSGEPSATPVRAVSYAEQASDTTQHKRRGLAFPDPASFPGSEIAAPFTLIIGIAFTDGPVTDLLIDAVCSMIIFGVVQRSTPGLLKIIVNVIVESLVFALPPILVLTITASVAAKLKDSLTAVILRAIQNYMEKAQPTLLSGLTHALVHTLHNGIATATVHATAPPLTHALSTSLTTSLVHFYYCTYCFYYHDYCRYCTQYQSYGQIERNWWRGMYKPPPDPDPSQNLGDLANAGEMVKIG